MNTDRAEKLAHRIMSRYIDLSVWSFKWHWGLLSAGLCDYEKREIKLSHGITEVLSPRQVRAILYHEVAHALTPDDPGHGEEWVQACRFLGCSANPHPRFLDKACGRVRRSGVRKKSKITKRR